MKRAAGIATDRGGRTCHAAIVSRELGIPCVVGTGNATNVLKPDQVVTVDGSQGKVYEGRVAAQATVPSTTAPKSAVKTRTKLYVNLADPEKAETVAARDVDGVGLLRAEFTISELFLPGLLNPDLSSIAPRISRPMSTVTSRVVRSTRSMKKIP
jgi:pyruvate,water dikinase